MKITVDYNEQKTEKKLEIVSAKYLGDYAIRINFQDGTERLIDFKPFLTKALHPSIRKYLDENKFKNFEIKEGNLNWNDYEMIFPIWDLYNGKIDY
ncbi:DUF2442 domain-containing protein [Methanohalobium sp.]|jgi:DUF971 family protein|uniref:DUF2442 domain-containing protein n=1 Tax=Methanohalobium sp. TaxID=2837493 RepID=UPI0025D0C67D|nr:DUF2442 domain-containing protein [Methanohalobium sp.]